MNTSRSFRRYLVPIDPGSCQVRNTDCLIIGAGIAGLRAALEVGSDRSVLVVTKGGLQDSNTWNAQGGIASVMDREDTLKAHADDTLKTACGLADEEVVRQVVAEGPGLIQELVAWGAGFDTKGEQLAMTIEGGHSHRRIIHAQGDKTGRAIAAVLAEKARQRRTIEIRENFYTIDLLTDHAGRCTGAIGHDGRRLVIINSSLTILATGGSGRLYRETTNPPVATGDGLAMAYRAGAVLEDLEFVQFHPTTLYVAGASRALITETLRGEGGLLVDTAGQRFMPDYHQDAELAPRDVVSRAILAQMLKTQSTHVYLDVRHLDKDYIRERFPLITELCEGFDIDISTDLVPVRPSAHYMIGGVKTDRNVRTNISNLLACGEAACSGLHGANRLGSNSLLEALVFGKEAGRQAGIEANTEHGPPETHCVVGGGGIMLDTADVINSLKALMWRNVGITRNAEQLTTARNSIAFWKRYVMDKVFDSPTGWECQNMLTVADLVAESALARRESRGVHYRSDFPDVDNEHFKVHITLRRPCSHS